MRDGTCIKSDFFNSVIYRTTNHYLRKNRQSSAVQLHLLPRRQHKVQFVELSNFAIEAAAAEDDDTEFKPALASGAPLALEDSVCNGFSSSTRPTHTLSSPRLPSSPTYPPTPTQSSSEPSILMRGSSYHCLPGLGFGCRARIILERLTRDAAGLIGFFFFFPAREESN